MWREKGKNKKERGISSPIIIILILLTSTIAIGVGTVLVRQRYQKPKAVDLNLIKCETKGDKLTITNTSDETVKADCVQQTCDTSGWSGDQCKTDSCNGNTPGNTGYRVLVGTTDLQKNQSLTCTVEGSGTCQVKQADWLVNGEYKCHIFSRSCPDPYTCGQPVATVAPTITPIPTVGCKKTCYPVQGLGADKEAPCSAGLSCLQVDAQHKECINPNCNYYDQNSSCNCVSLGCKETCYPLIGQSGEGTCRSGLSCLQVDAQHKECINSTCDYYRQGDTCQCLISPAPSPRTSVTPSVTSTPTLTLTPTTTLTPIPSIPPGDYCICAQAKVYEENWTHIEDLRNIQAGKTYHLTVFGQASKSDMYPGRARFRINGAANNTWCLGSGRSVINNWCEVNGEGRHVGHTGNPEYFVDFKIPEAGGTFTVETEVFCPTLGWK